MDEKQEAVNGNLLLECGHRQRVSSIRYTLATNGQGQQQHAVWCVVCDDWREPTVEGK